MFCGESIIGVLIALVAIVIGYCKWTFQYWQRRGLQFLEPEFPFGSLGETLKGKETSGIVYQKIYNEIKSKGWKHAGVYFFLKPVYFVVDLDYVKNILTKDFQYFADRKKFFNEKDEPLSANLVNLTGTRWQNLRSKLTPTFTPGKIKMMFQSLVECEGKLQKTMEEACLKQKPIDIRDVLVRFTIETIGSCAFGLNCKTLEQPDSPFRVYSKKHFTVANSRMRLFKITFASTFPKLGLLLGIADIPKDVADFYLNVVYDNVGYREKNNFRRNDFFQLLIDLKNDKLVEQDGAKHDSGGLTMNEVAAQSYVFFLAGFVTTSSLMTFALYELSRNQDIQDKLRAEIRSILAKYDDELSYDAIQEMKYLSQVIDESLRMYPPIPRIERICTKDYKLPDDDIIIEKGTRVIIPTMGIHYDKDLYPNPEKFEPERFKNKDSRSNFSHIPFGVGPRNCIGMRFALMQAKVGLASLIRSFRFTVSNKTKEPLQMEPLITILVVKGDGIWLNAEKCNPHV